MSEIQITLEDVVRELKEIVANQSQDIAILRAMLAKARSIDVEEDKV